MCKKPNHDNAFITKKAGRPTTSPEFKMFKTWVFYITFPVGLVAWTLSGNLFIAVAAGVFPFILAIVQGTIGIVRYRLFHGVSPFPDLPAHGVVVVNPEDKTFSSSSKSRDLLERAIIDNHKYPHAEAPLRLLVLGDSLAIGVGQKKSATPIMPEVIAKTLSKAMNGRVVYWTCHGAPGASVGWLVRELERGVQSSRGKNERDEYIRQTRMDDDEGEDEYVNESFFVDDSVVEGIKEEEESNCSETSDESDSSCDELSSDDEQQQQQQQQPKASFAYTREEKRRSMKIWRERLKQHRKRFDPDLLGTYDIVVVIAGSNDLKCAFFPFLLKGEDLELTRQRNKRGGAFSYELIRIREALTTKMRIRLKNLRESVDHWRSSKKTGRRLALVENEEHVIESKYDLSSTIIGDEGRNFNATSDEGQHDGPLIVIPGMPSRALPIFRIRPLRWLAIPIVDIMDSQKNNLARSHPAFMYTEPVSLEAVDQYEHQTGKLWEQKCEEDVILSLKDVRKSASRHLEAEMKSYYKTRKKPAKTIGDKIFSIDNIHPNDEGYDFWGRQIANSVVQQWMKKQL